MTGTSEAELEALYRAAVGPTKADYYAPRFLRFDQPGASRASWNWPAFFVSFLWFLYRRMYRDWAIYCLLTPLLLGFAAGVVAALVGGAAGAGIGYLITLGYSFVVLPSFANSLYHGSIKRRITALQAKVPEQATQLTVLENSPHTSHIFVVVVLFLIIPVIGILAAIAIPAYQNYTIRAQVAEGLLLSAPFKVKVSEALIGGADVESLSTIGLGLSLPSSAKYVADLQVIRGAVAIKYGASANPLIANQALVLTPGIAANGNIVWICGTAHAPEGVRMTVDNPQKYTTVPPQYLPQSCRADAR